MCYFENNHPLLKLIEGSKNQIGLRTAQLGAIFATASHFTIKDDPALVVMPTGSGKSIVLMTLCYLLKAKRVLILTPSKLLRDQIYDDFRKLDSIKKFEILPKETEPPKIKEVKNRVKSKKEWNEFKKFDVVIGTPNCLSPKAHGVSSPPDDLFDLILVDEAHHSPAKTWAGAIEAYPKASKVLVTATPFRNDKKEIRAKFVYVYPLKHAFDDKIFGNIRFIPVNNALSGDDGAIAKVAEKTLASDRKKKLEHYLIVRTDSKKKANELEIIYKKNTKLKLSVIHSGHGFKHIKSTIKKLKNGELDGVIAVAMLGEGFDFPNLKIAAIHSPHKSLPVTLQFIGRFARTGNEKLGEAKFIAIPNEIKIQSEGLYRENASWQEIITNLVQTQVESEVKIKQDLESFQSIKSLPDEIDVSLYSLKPYSHVKIYRVSESVNMQLNIDKIQGKIVTADGFSEDLNVRYFLCREEFLPKWTDSRNLAQVTYDLHVVYFDKKSNLIFINSTDRTFALYEELSKAFCPDGHQVLTLVEINRVIRSLKNPEFFNIGMKSSVHGLKTESYRIVSGSNAQRTVSQTDGFLFHRGHVFGKGTTEKGDVTIGYSSASKVWSHAYARIPELIDWCKGIAKNIMDKSPVKTNSNLDHLGVGEIIDKLPGTALFCDWQPGVLRKNIKLIHKPSKVNCLIVDADLKVIEQKGNIVSFEVIIGKKSKKYSFDITAKSFFSSENGKDEEVLIQQGRDKPNPLIDFFNDDPLNFYLTDYSRVRGKELFQSHDLEAEFDSSNLLKIDWNGVALKSETDESAAKVGKKSIHERTREYIKQSDPQLLVFDDRSGEIADFISVNHNDQETHIQLFHCKASKKDFAGHRVNDLYEVCGQAAKSLLRLPSVAALITRLEHRVSEGSPIEIGDISYLRLLKTAIVRDKTKVTVNIVQPGLKSEGITESVQILLVSTEAFLQRVRDVDFKVICN